MSDRFQYDLVPTADFQDMLAGERIALVHFCEAFELTPTDLTSWAATGYVPHWARLAALLYARTDFDDARPASLHRSLETWSITPTTLARLLGVPKATVLGWMRNSIPQPPHLALLLGALHLGGAIKTARKLAANTIALDLTQPELGPYPFKTARADRTAQTKSAPLSERAIAE